MFKIINYSYQIAGKGAQDPIRDAITLFDSQAVPQAASWLRLVALDFLQVKPPTPKEDKKQRQKRATQQLDGSNVGVDNTATLTNSGVN